MKAREEALAKDEERHQQLKEESKKQVSALLHTCICGVCPVNINTILSSMPA